MTPTNTAPTQVHPIELALVLMLGLLQQLAWLIRTIAVPLIAVCLAASPRLSSQVIGVKRLTPNPAPVGVTRVTPNPAPVSVTRVTLDSAPVGVTRVTPEPPLRPGTVKQLRQQCRDLGLPSKQWRSAKKDTLVQLLAEAPKAMEVAAVS